MLLSKLIPDVELQEDVEIRSLAFDDRQVVPGSLFFCVQGYSRDSHDFAADAVEQGAAALVVERVLGLGVPEVVVESVRRSMGPLADRFYSHPSGDIDVIGITGTNGKTTTAFLIRTILESIGIGCGLVGTVETIVGGEQQSALRTTPEAIDLQRLFRTMADAGDQAAAIEVSSHALELGRVDGTTFRVAAFTNLTQDHLDFHETFERYWQAKARLFTELDPQMSVINIDDPHGVQLAESAPNPVTCSIDGKADWTITALATGLRGSSFEIHSPIGTAHVETPLTGRFNAQNILVAAACCAAVGVSLDAIVAALRSAGQVPGRFEAIEEGQAFAAVVDYAHTPDSLENVLSAARLIADGKVICVVGCGGDRDSSKRPLMGEISGRLADLTWVTSDNPRSEDPSQIIDQIVAGIAGEYSVEPDRAEAIEAALSAAQPGDVVVVAGKGHESGQEFANREVVPFDDRDVVRTALRKLVGDRL